MNSNSNENRPRILVRPTSDYSTEPQEKAEEAANALPAIGDALAAPAQSFWEKLTSGIENPPKEVEVQLSLAFEGKLNWAIVSAAAGATVMVNLKWDSGS
jgi:hypothetical protein